MSDYEFYYFIGFSYEYMYAVYLLKHVSYHMSAPLALFSSVHAQVFPIWAFGIDGL